MQLTVSSKFTWDVGSRCFSWRKIQGIPSSPHASPKKQSYNQTVLIRERWGGYIREEGVELVREISARLLRELREEFLNIINILGLDVPCIIGYFCGSLFSLFSPLISLLECLRFSSQLRSHYSLLEVICDWVIVWKIAKSKRLQNQESRTSKS